MQMLVKHQLHNPQMALLLRRNHQLLVGSVKDDVLRAEHDITVDLEVGTTVALDSTEAGVGIDLSEGDGVSGNHGHVGGSNGDTEIRELGVAGICESTDLSVVDGTGNLLVVGIGDLLVNKEERSSGIWEISMARGSQ